MKALLPLTLAVCLAGPGYPAAAAASSATADNPAADGDWLKITERLRQSGGPIGAFNVAKFVASARALHWKPLSAGPDRPVTAENRQSAYFDRSTKTIYLSDDAFHLPAEVLAQLELHEALGALKYQDAH